MKSEAYDVDARVDESTAREFASLSAEQREERLKPMLQAVLRERFHAAVKVTQAEGWVYALSVGSHGPKLTVSAVASSAKPTGIAIGDGGSMMPISTSDGGHAMRFTHTSMTKFAEALSGLATTADPPIENQTGLAGYFDFTLVKHDEESTQGAAPQRASQWDVGALGLVLKRAKEATPALTLEQIEKPSQN